MGGSKNKIAVAGLASILLVAAVVGVALTASRRDSHDVVATNKAVVKMCSDTDYRLECQMSMKKAKTADPEELLATALDYTSYKIQVALKRSELLKKASKDKSTKAAYEVCHKVLDRAVGDLKSSIGRVSNFNVTTVKKVAGDLKTWLSAVITMQETCIDAFKETKGDTGERMKQLLKTTKQLSSNALAMLTNLQKMLGQLDIKGIENDIEKMLKGAKGAADTGRKVLWYEERMMEEAKPSIFVAQDGSTPFKTIQAAIDSVPEGNNVPVTISVKAGIYKEIVNVPKKKNLITIVGDDAATTRVTGSLNFELGGVKTFQSATFSIDAEDFTARQITFENTAGPEGHQAVALRVSGDRAVFHDVNIEGYQDTLYAHAYRQFYRDCRISGTIDFIFGDALCIFQKCVFTVRLPMKNQGCMVTAQGRTDWRSEGAIVIQDSSIVGEKALIDAQPPINSYLGRPWKAFSRTVYMNCNIDGFIVPQGWSVWNGDLYLDTLYYAEWANKGPGANLDQRVNWKGIQKWGPADPPKFAAGLLYHGDEWITRTGVPYTPDLNFV